MTLTSDLSRAQTADLGSRFVARLLDSLLLGGIFAVAIVVVAVLGSVSETAATIIALLTYVAAPVAAIFYEVRGVGRLGQTIGRRVAGIRVVDEASGSVIGGGRAFTRMIVFFLMGLPCYLGYISFFTDSTGQGRAWHDKAANDRVIRVPSVGFGQALRDVWSGIRP